tara:strand:- start:472 stop:789 length:318 start_codon:yes stop_codon:yes gene_type:complete
MIINRSQNNLQSSIWNEKLLSNPDATIFDLRPGFIKKTQGINKSQSLDLTNMQNLIQLLDKMDKKQIYFLYCENGEISSQVSCLMDSLEFENIHYLTGGLEKLNN